MPDSKWDVEGLETLEGVVELSEEEFRMLGRQHWSAKAVAVAVVA